MKTLTEASRLSLNEGSESVDLKTFNLAELTAKQVGRAIRNAGYIDYDVTSVRFTGARKIKGLLYLAYEVNYTPIEEFPDDTQSEFYVSFSKTGRIIAELFN